MNLYKSTRKDRDEIKTMIIENYIDWFTHDEDERDRMKAEVFEYVDGDHVDEIGQAYDVADEDKITPLDVYFVDQGLSEE